MEREAERKFLVRKTSDLMKEGFFAGIVLLIVILLFTIIDHWIHGLENAWNVPDYYFVNKIPFGFLWGVVGLLFARKFQNIWLKAMIVSGVIAVTLQTRYFIEGYPLDFVLLFLLIHFVILYFLSVGMFLVFNKFNNKMNKIIIALVVLAIVGIGIYYLVFNKNSAVAPAYTPPTSNNDQVNNPAPAVQSSTTPALAAANPVSAPANVTVSIKNFSFNPSTVTVKTGTKVTWVNNDSFSHTITSDSGNLLNSSAIAPGQSFSFTFANPGSATYHCSIHPTMKGTVVVEN